jgi:hypothetical protein
METEQGRDEPQLTPEDEGIPEHGGPARGKRETGDPQEGLLLPDDEPRAADRSGTTAEEQREGESLDEKLAEELPDRESSRRTSMGRLIEPASGVTDREKEEVAEEAEDDRSGLTPEEAAMRDEENPDGLTDGPDRYVQDEGP